RGGPSPAVVACTVALDPHDTRFHVLRDEVERGFLVLGAPCGHASDQDDHEDRKRQQAFRYHAPPPRLGRPVPHRMDVDLFAAGHSNLPFIAGPIRVRTPPEALGLELGAAASAVDRVPTGRGFSSSLDTPPVRLDAKPLSDRCPNPNQPITRSVWTGNATLARNHVGGPTDPLTTIAAADSGRKGTPSLIQRAQAGDAAAFEALVRPRLDRCFRIAWAVL